MDIVLEGWTLTSILRPSTSVPWSFSLALSASELDSNVTKPKPCEERRRAGKRGEAAKQAKTIIQFLFYQKQNTLMFEGLSLPSYLGASLVENDLNIKDFAKLLKRKRRRREIRILQKH